METTIKKLKDILIVSPAYSSDHDIIRDLNASREIYKGWDINYIGLGFPMQSYINAKIENVKKFAELFKNKYEWLIVMDSNDTLVIRDFDENEIKSKLESFNKPIIFNGDTSCYPIKEFEAFYKSNSIIKYLNSGFIAIKNGYAEKLFNYVLDIYKNFPIYKTIGWNPPGDQTYYQLAHLSNELRNDITIDEEGEICVSTFMVPNELFEINNNELIFNSKTKPFILHCQGNDKHARKRYFMKNLGIPVRG